MPRILPKRWFTILCAYCIPWFVLSVWSAFFALHTTWPDIFELGGSFGFFILCGAMAMVSELRPSVRTWLMGDWRV